MPQFVVTAASKSLTTWEASGNVANGANISITDNRVLCSISTESQSVKLEGYNDQDAWDLYQDRVGNITAPAASQVIVINGHLPTDATYLRLNNASGAAQDYRLTGWYLA